MVRCWDREVAGGAEEAYRCGASECNLVVMVVELRLDMMILKV